MNDNRLYKDIGKIALGYVFIYFNFNINTLNVLPTFVGYWMIVHAIRNLEQEEPELRLLRPFGIILIMWHSVSWILNCFSVDISGMIVIADILVGLINLYFHFQLLTNLASIVSKYQKEGDETDNKLLHYRTLHTVILTVIIIINRLSDLLEEYAAFITIGLAIIYIIIGILVMKALFDLRKSLMETTESE